MSYIKEKDLVLLPSIRDNDFIRIVTNEGLSRLYEIDKFVAPFATDIDIPTKVSQLDDSDLKLLRSNIFQANTFQRDISNKIDFQSGNMLIFLGNTKSAEFTNKALNIPDLYFGVTKNNRFVNFLTGRSGSLTIKSVKGPLYIGFIDPHKEVPRTVFMNGAFELSGDKNNPILFRRDILVLNGRFIDSDYKLASYGFTESLFTFKDDRNDYNIIEISDFGGDPIIKFMDGAFLVGSFQGGIIVNKEALFTSKTEFNSEAFFNKIRVSGRLNVRDLYAIDVSYFDAPANFNDGIFASGNSEMSKLHILDEIILSFRKNLERYTINRPETWDGFRIYRLDPSSSGELEIIKFLDDDTGDWSSLEISFMGGAMKVIRDNTVIVEESLFVKRDIYLGSYGNTGIHLTFENNTLVIDGNVKVKGTITQN